MKWTETLKRDKVMSRLLDEEVPLKKVERYDVFVDLIRAIIGQQVSVHAARSIFNKFLNGFEDRWPTPESVYRFSEEELKTFGLSRQKAHYIANIAKHFCEHELKDEDFYTMDDQAVLKELTSIKGVGEWTAQMILMFSLDREDILPHKDLSIQLSMMKLYNFEAKGRVLFTKMDEIAENWRPYRTWACRLLWSHYTRERTKATKSKG